MSKRKNLIVRNLTFGIQDSFGSTVGFLSGVAVSGMEKDKLLFSGILLILVEAFSMALGSLISEHVVQETETKRSLPMTRSLLGPITMFFAYLISGLVPLAPYILFWGPYSLSISIGISLFVISVIGYINAKRYRISPMHHIKETVLISILAIIVGVIIGKIFPI